MVGGLRARMVCPHLSLNGKKPGERGNVATTTREEIVSRRSISGVVPAHHHDENVKAINMRYWRGIKP